jgi:hypothetical protein
LGYSINGRNHKKLNGIIEEHNIDITHFDNGNSKRRKYEYIDKICPVCNTNFKTKKGHKQEKTTCSYACSNTHFRSGDEHGNWRPFSEYGDDELRTSNFSKKYRNLCFKYHKHECVVCGEDKILDVHHYDGNRKNNDPSNLIPLCPTHHNYYHSKYKEEVKDKIDEYYYSFIKSGEYVDSLLYKLTTSNHSDKNIKNGYCK